jgi:50S ribosomal protein L16 3-hydroxylase
MQAQLPLEVRGSKLFKDDGTHDEKEAAAFLKAYWQRQPVLLRQALTFESPITPDELAGLSLEEEVASRVIINWAALGDMDPALRPPNKNDFELLRGPFSEDTFTSDEIPDTCYTLLCNNVASFLPQLSRLAERFNFVPNWRHEDIMISYAAKGGGVGPHVDNYDVFLLQGRGTRQWSVSATPIPADQEELVEGIDVRVLKGGFEPDATWLLQPGDMLYVPPRCPHWGVAMDDECMTFSVGFRAPNLQDMASEFANHMCDSRSPDDFYTDSALTPQVGDAGRISEEAVASMWRDVEATILGYNHTHMHTASAAALLSTPSPAFRMWVGGFLTQNLRRAAAAENARATDPTEAQRILADVVGASDPPVTLLRNEDCKVAWLTTEDGLAVAADGQVWKVAHEASSEGVMRRHAAVLCSSHALQPEALLPLLAPTSLFRPIVQEWLEKGILYCPTEEDEELVMTWEGEAEEDEEEEEEPRGTRLK